VWTETRIGGSCIGWAECAAAECRWPCLVGAELAKVACGPGCPSQVVVSLPRAAV